MNSTLFFGGKSIALDLWPSTASNSPRNTIQLHLQMGFRLLIFIVSFIFGWLLQTIFIPFSVLLSSLNAVKLNFSLATAVGRAFCRSFYRS